MASPFSPSVLNGVERSASCPCRLTPGERTPAVHWIGGFGSARASRDAVETRNVSCPCPESNPNSLPFQPVAIPTELSVASPGRPYNLKPTQIVLTLGLSNYRLLSAIRIVVKHDSVHYYILKNVQMCQQLLLL
jgi:hypothetical protein